MRSGATGMLPLGGLPAIPAALAAARACGAHDEAQQPDDQHDDRKPPQCLQRETRAEEDQSQQKNDKQGNHSYQPPSLLVPGECQNTRSISLVSPPLMRALDSVSPRRPPHRRTELNAEWSPVPAVRDMFGVFRWG